MMITVNFDDFGRLSVDGDTSSPFKLGMQVKELIGGDDEFLDDEIQKIGQELFDNIFSSESRLKKLESALSSGEQVAIKIVAEDKTIHNIPFELLYNGANGGFFAKNITPLIRDIPNSIKRNPQTTLDVINMLIVISLPLEVYKTSPLDPLVELETIYESLENELRDGKINIDVQERANEEDIRKALERKEYQILYFSGHGGSGGLLVMEKDEKGYEERLTEASELANIFAYKNSIRLFILNACESAKSSPVKPSAAHAIYDKLPNATVIANTYSVEDANATKTMRLFFNEFAKNLSPAKSMQQARSSLQKEWFKPVIFASENSPLFALSGRATQKTARLSNTHKEHIVGYVYRYTLTREASNLIENGQKYLVLHGIGGSGKSTMAKYLARFFAGKFGHSLFFDVRDYDSPEKIVDEILKLAKRAGLVEAKTIEKISKEKDEEERIYQKIELFFAHIKGKLFLILDNLEGVAQDENGVLLKNWKEAIKLLTGKDIFILFTSRLKVLEDKRTPYNNTLTISDYNQAEIGFLWNTLSKIDASKADYLYANQQKIFESFGRHPLALSKALEHRPVDLEKMFETSDFKDYFEFYRAYLDKYANDAKKLFSLENSSIAKEFAEGYINIDFINLLKTELLLLTEDKTHYTMPPVVYRYFQKEYL